MRPSLFSFLLLSATIITPVQAADVEPVFITTATCPDNSSYVKGYWSCPDGYDKNIVGSVLKSCTKKVDCSKCSDYPYTTLGAAKAACGGRFIDVDTCTCQDNSYRYKCSNADTCEPYFDKATGKWVECSIK